MSLSSASLKTKQWVKDFVIKENHCPYAAKPFDADIIRYEESLNSDAEKMTEDFINEINFIDKKSPRKLSTTLLIYSKLEMTFLDFYQLAMDFEDILEAIRLEHKFQIVAFHPEFRFIDKKPEDIINRLNRSPYPMIHILRVDEVTKALESRES